VTLVRADARALPFADSSVDLVVTSPPYFALRSYTDGGEHYAGQIGSEPTPASYIGSLLEVTRECMRVLKPAGSIWVNLGDKYASDSRGPDGSSSALTNGAQQRPGLARASAAGVPRKSLIGLPWRYAIRCMDELGLILRSEVIWSKPNGLPESVGDRVRRSHETWFHFVQRGRYFSAVDAIRTPAVRDDARASGKRYSGHIPGIGRKHQGLAAQPNHPLGSLPGSVWEVATEPLTVPAHLGADHFAAFPTEWPRRIITGWSPSGICTACEEGRRPVFAKVRTNGSRGAVTGAMFQPGQRIETADGKRHEFQTEATITGEACACSHASAPTRRAIVLDPFGGTGTTALVAEALGRRGVSVDMSADYLRIAAWRTSDPGQCAKALGVPRPPAETAGQLDLFGDPSPVRGTVS
jgi:DNA modification methylase